MNPFQSNPFASNVFSINTFRGVGVPVPPSRYVSGGGGGGGGIWTAAVNSRPVFKLITPKMTYTCDRQADDPLNICPTPISTPDLDAEFALLIKDEDLVAGLRERIASLTRQVDEQAEMLKANGNLKSEQEALTARVATLEKENAKLTRLLLKVESALSSLRNDRDQMGFTKGIFNVAASVLIVVAAANLPKGLEPLSYMGYAAGTLLGGIGLYQTIKGL